MIDLSDKTNWKKFKFSEVARLITESCKDPSTEGIERYVGLEHLEPETLTIKTWGNVAEGTTFTRRFRPGDMLFGRRRSYQKKASLAEFDGICSGDILVFRAKEENMIAGLLPYIVQNETFFERAVKTSAGSLSPRTKFKDLADLEITLPKLEDQPELLKLLISASEYENKCREVNECLKELIDAAFHSISPIDTKIVRVSDLAAQVSQTSIPPHKHRNLIVLDVIKSGDSFNYQYADSADAKSNLLVFEEGDILYSKLRPYLDKAIIASQAGVCTTEMVVLRPNSERDKDLLIELLHSNSLKNSMTHLSYGTKMPRVSAKILLNYEINLPADSTSLIERIKNIRMKIDEIVESEKRCRLIISSIKEQLL